MKHALRVVVAVVAVSLLVLALPAAAQTSLQIVPDRSVGVLSEDPSTGERWSTSVFPFGNYVGPASGDDVFCRTYLRFPLDGVPSGAAVRSATLHVYVDDYWPDADGAPMSVYPVMVDWTVGGVDWYDMGAWPALGGGVYTTNVSADADWVAWDVTSLVQGWVGGVPNYGLALAAADPGSTVGDWAAARRRAAGDPATSPYLEVLFSTTQPPATIPEAGTLLLLGSGTAALSGYVGLRLKHGRRRSLRGRPGRSAAGTKVARFGM